MSHSYKYGTYCVNIAAHVYFKNLQSDSYILYCRFIRISKIIPNKHIKVGVQRSAVDSEEF